MEHLKRELKTLRAIQLFGAKSFFMFTILILLPGVTGAAGSDSLSLETAISKALLNDPWLIGNQHTQDAVESLSVAAGTLPDPKVSLGLVNLATDTFDFNQEAMTQLKIGVSQMFPRGDTLEIKQKQLELLVKQFPFQRQDRKAKVVVTVSQLWLGAHLAQESIALIEKDRPLFEQLADVAEAGYSSGFGKTRQQDIIRAQLELTRLDDRLTVLRQKKDVALEKLSQWLSDFFVSESVERDSAELMKPRSGLVLKDTLPDIVMINSLLYTSKKKIDPQSLYDVFKKHPAVMGHERKIEASKAGVDLAKQKYKPEWGVNASYGYRGNDQRGNDRADFISAGVSVDLPFFTSNRQDKEVQSAISKASAIKTEKWMLVRKMIADFEKTKAQLIWLKERGKLYQQELLPQMHEQAEASLTAYTNDDGDFSEAVRARIAELNTLIDSYTIEVERQKTIIQLNYYLMQNADEMIASSTVAGDS